MFVDYLQTAFAHVPDGPVGYELLKEHRNKVSEGLLKYESDPSVGPKYRWLATYHNYACQMFSDRFRIRGDEEPDPYEIAGAAEAQRVLDCRVPFDNEAAEQLPRPLDAERLQQRLAGDQT